jgi:PAS domain S-box-containing protein
MIHWIDGRRVKLQIATDISEYRAYQKALIQAHSKYKELFDHAVVGIFQSTPRGRFLNVNPAMASILGYDSPEDLVNRVTDIRAQVYVDPEARDRLHHRLLEPGDRDEQEVQVKRKDGSVIWVAESTRLVRDDFGRVEFYEGFLTDITERRHSQERIQAQLAEKEVLLREIHHRVKNNLQIVSSLLNLQSGKVDHGPLADIITDSRNRILSMALVHEELYRTEDLGRVDLASYVGRLTHRLGSTGPQLEVDIPADTPHMPCSINQAIPSGLIINELVTNAAKHAFAGKEPGLVRIRLERIDGDFRVTVTDNGVGLPESFDPDGTETLGFQLVMNLVRQIDGEFFIRREPESGGSCMGFRFPVQNEDLPG